jgi:catechol 2,3-dioxygenase-like lactoylglutathione lyase family enzyme
VRPRGVYETVLYSQNVPTTAAFYSEAIGLRLVDGPDELAAAFRLDDGGVLLIFDPARSGMPKRPVPSHGSEGPGHIGRGRRARRVCRRAAFARHRDRARGRVAAGRPLDLRPRPGRQLGRAGRGRPLAAVTLRSQCLTPSEAPKAPALAGLWNVRGTSARVSGTVLRQAEPPADAAGSTAGAPSPSGVDRAGGRPRTSRPRGRSHRRRLPPPGERCSPSARCSPGRPGSPRA